MPERQIYTVSQLTARIGAVLEQQLAPFWVEGEISNLRAPGSGHAYFTLKDDQAQVRAVLFRNRLRRIRFQPVDGLHVVVFGSLEVYAARGEYQMVVELMEPRGLGALQLAFEQLKEKLRAEGLFDAARKRPLPRFPRKIGIVTSPSGAAIQDMLRIIHRRFAGVHIVIRPAPVQGEGAAAEIAEAIGDLNLLGDVDVLIVGRGGGSLEDLWAFNEEVVARAIVRSKVPVISAVGHEGDVTIADFVADLRAATPSAAAEMVVREKDAVRRGLAELRERLTGAMARLLDRRRERLRLLTQRRILGDPSRGLRDLYRRLDELSFRLRAALTTRHGQTGHRLALAAGRLRAASPFVRLGNQRRALAHLQSRLVASAHRSLDHGRHRLRVAAGRLEGLSPLAVLRRGYSVTRRPSGEVVQRASQVTAGDTVAVLLHEGSLECRVLETRERDDRPQV